MTTHPSPHRLRPQRRLRRPLGWTSLGAALALSASCAAAAAAPSDNDPRPCAIGTYEMRVTGGPLTARFTARGVVAGRYEPDGDGWAFTHTRAAGTASLRLPVVGTTRIPLTDVGSSMVPDGRASISCHGGTVTMTSAQRPAITLTLGDE
jgi:DNA mismatch repair protein MutH